VLYYNFIGDIIHYITIKHPVMSVVFVPEGHLYTMAERTVTLAIGFLFSFFVLIQDPDLSTLAAG
jgi:hypothetical protein